MIPYHFSDKWNDCARDNFFYKLLKIKYELVTKTSLKWVYEKVDK